LVRAPLLEVRELSVRRGILEVVHRASLDILGGTIVGLLGLNGAGKSSLLSAIAGELSAHSGTVSILGTDVSSRREWDRCKHGLVLVPASRQLIPQMSVLDNLMIGGHLVPKKERTAALGDVFDLFPVLKIKARQQAGSLSGGQQQMVAVGRGLMARPKVLMLDEPSEGLAPVVVDEMFIAIKRLRDDVGLGILLAEQNVGVLEILDTVAMMSAGSITETEPVAAADAVGIGRYMFGQ